MIKKLLCTASLLFTLGAFTQDFEELMMVVADDRDTEDRFGWSCDIDGDFAVVGAYADDFGDANPNMGSAYVYERIAGEWIQIQKLSNSDQDDYDRFGWDVEIQGDFIIVGAYGEDHDAEDGAYLSKAGSAYIFERGGDGVWDEVQKLVPSDRAADDEFGWSVSIYGTTAIVGAHIDDKNEVGAGSFYHAGSVYIFDREMDGSWTQTQKIVASDRSPGTVYADDHEDWNDRFGESISLWNDYLVVGAPYASKGYVFERIGDVWSEVSFLTYPGISWLDRAYSVAIDSTTIILGAHTEDLNADYEESLMNAGGAAVYRRTGGTWTHIQNLSPADRDAGDHFGYSVGIDGDYIVIGTHSDNHDEDGGDEIENTGSVYVFDLQEDGTYAQLIKLDASDRTEDDELGISIAISESTIISGAFQQDETPDGGDYLEDAGSAYFYTNLEDGGGETCEDVFVTQEFDICSGEEVEVGGSVYDESGVYTDILTTHDGCDSVVTTILEVAEEIETEQEFEICEGEFVLVGDSYYDETGFYIDEFESIAGCDSIVYTFVDVADAINTAIVVDEATLTAVAIGVEYQWIMCDPYEIIDGATEQEFTAEESGNYAVIITAGECVDTSACQSIEIEDDPGSGIEESAFSASISIYPNPSNGSFTINGAQLNGSLVQIYNPIGALIYENRIISTPQTVNIQNQATGIYILKLTSEFGTKIEKIDLK